MPTVAIDAEKATALANQIAMLLSGQDSPTSALALALIVDQLFAQKAMTPGTFLSLCEQIAARRTETVSRIVPAAVMPATR
jgi:hypothetical protein